MRDDLGFEGLDPLTQVGAVIILRVRTSRSFFGSPCLSLTVANPRPE
jgi:hypothetical protein